MGSMQTEMQKLQELKSKLLSQPVASLDSSFIKEQKRLAGIPERYPRPPPKPEPKPKPSPTPEPGGPNPTPIQTKKLQEEIATPIASKPVAAWNLVEYAWAAQTLCEELENRFKELVTNLEKYTPIKEEQALKPGRTYRDLKCAVKEMQERALKIKRVAKDIEETLKST